ncbi:hypothetical protein [Thalassospira tepidiphila]|uniref:hypothetical protein n=1 Tax=Thalassospira tepidiphila TaxID=393657 RepID=UPI0030C6C390
MSDARIALHFDVHEPIELVDLTLSFQAVAREYRAHLIETVKAAGGKAKDADVKLYVTDIRNNCIWAELGGATEIMGQLFSTMDYVNIFAEFVRNIGNAVEFFKKVAAKGDVEPSEIPYSKRQTNSVADILKTAAKNRDGALGLSVINYETDAEGSEKIELKFSHKDASEARRGALLSARALERKGDADHKNVLMYFHQANIDEPKAHGRTGFRGIIKSISDLDLPVHFISDLDRDRINDLVQDPTLNPFKASYRVDVNVETDRNDKPKFYRVAVLHEVLPDDE